MIGFGVILIFHLIDGHHLGTIDGGIILTVGTIMGGIVGDGMDTMAIIGVGDIK
jgi:hypothetical protein